MPDNKILTIDNKEYALDTLTDVVKKDVLKLRAIDREISRLNVQLAIAQTARTAVAGNIKNNLPDQSGTN
jgi:hypothetical protein